VKVPTKLNPTPLLRAHAIAGLLGLCGCGDGCAAAPEGGGDMELSPTSCGPCAWVGEGEVGVSGARRIDTLFEPTRAVHEAVRSTRADFDRDVRALARVWGAPIDPGATVGAARVAALFEDIETQLTADAEAPWSLHVTPGSCSADVARVAAALQQCEHSLDCERDMVEGELALRCEGDGHGACEGSCDTDVACNASEGLACAGVCEGVCVLEGSCEGRCDGTCIVEGIPEDGFAGACAGVCEGTCALAAGRVCDGTCFGTCILPSDAAASCTTSTTCHGRCEYVCNGRCLGTAAPSAPAIDCEHGDDCSTNAALAGEVAAVCTPARLLADLRPAAGTDANARALFDTRMNALRSATGSVGQRHARLRALMVGDYDADGIADVEPVAGRLQSALVRLAEQGTEAFDDVALDIRPCVAPSLREAAQALEGLGDEALDTVAVHDAFFTAVHAL